MDMRHWASPSLFTRLELQSKDTRLNFGPDSRWLGSCM